MTSLIDDILRQAERLRARATLPRVRALHLPPRQAVAGSRGAARGEFCALELDDGTLGLAYVLLDDHHEALLRGDGQGGLVGADPFEVAQGLRAPAGGVHRVLGWAAVNAMTRWFHDRTGYVAPESSDSFGQMQLGPGASVGMVGLFGPLVERVLASGARLTVLELRTDLVGARDGLRVTLDPAALAGCPQVLCTSTVLFNDTLDAVMTHCRGTRWFALVGPSAGCWPDALFARRVTLVGGSWITDAMACVAALTAGETLRAGTRKCAIEPAGYPGFEALLQRL